MHQKTPSALIAITFFHSSSLTSWVRSELPDTPAEQTSTSIGPSSAVTCADGGIDVGRGGDVAGEGEHPIQARGGEVERRDLRPLGEEAGGHGSADPARGSRDERDPAKESIIVCHGFHPIKFRR